MSVSGSEQKRRNIAFGNERVGLLKLFYERLGFYPKCYPSLHNNAGVDLVVYVSDDSRRIAYVVEATNYGFIASNGHLEQVHRTNFTRKIEALNWYDVIGHIGKLFVVSFHTNLSGRQRERLETDHIQLWVIGFQSVPYRYRVELGHALYERLKYDEYCLRLKE
jgi:hypothetical protein